MGVRSGNHPGMSGSGRTGIGKVMNDTRNSDRTVLRIVTATGTSSRATDAAIGQAAHEGRRPEDFDIAVSAAQRFILRVAFGRAQFLLVLLLLFRMFCVHVHCPIERYTHFPVFLSKSIAYPLLETHRRSVREVLEIRIEKQPGDPMVARLPVTCSIMEILILPLFPCQHPQ